MPTATGKNDLFTIADVVGEQHTQSSPEFADKSEQYASSTYGTERINPASVIYAKCEDDIKAVLKHANAQHPKIAVAVRTGGHQYSGASSTVAPNIQLDLSKTFRDDNSSVPTGNLVYNKETSEVRVGVSHSLEEFNAFMGQNQIFVPHGQCITVHLGGHVQSGGYGQLGRSFGLLGDHVTKLEVVTAEGESEVYTKKSHPDMFWATLGGSPGNFCVLKHFTIQVHKDEDYRGSMGLKCMFFYDKGILKRLLKIIAKMSDDKDFPRNYDMCVNVVSSRNQIEKYFPGIKDPLKEQFPDKYGKNRAAPGATIWPRFISVWAQWVPLEENMNCNMQWFRDIEDGCFWREDSLGQEMPPAPVTLKPMSQLTADWIFRFEREFDFPYVKSTHVTNSTTLLDDGWAAWLTGRIDNIISPNNNGCYLSAQIQPFGGKNSMFHRNKGNGTAYSWRDHTLCITLDAFYDPAVPTSKATATEWHETTEKEAIGSKGYFSPKDLRVLWGSYGGYDLHADKDKYYDDATYTKLAGLRAKADPHGVLTPNTFAVRAKPASKSWFS